jgi:hypothetical protein
MEHRFTLEKYTGMASRHTCPSCGKLKKFARYINTEIGLPLADHVGRCNREVECGYHYRPSDYFKENPSAICAKAQTQRHKRKTQNGFAIAKPFDTIPTNLVNLSLSHAKSNHFAQFLRKRFGDLVVSEIAKRFCIGTSKHWLGATVFWQVDAKNQVRTGKVILFHPENENVKRVKTPYDHVTWVHSILINKGLIVEPFRLEQCLFGIHQINSGKVKEVIVVESEKTAIIGSIYLPEYTWMACGGLSMLSVNRLQPLKRFRIILYPDLKAMDKWQAKAKEFCAKGFQVTVSHLLETVATSTEREAGHDLADYLLKLDPPKSTVQKLIELNPNIQSLFERFDLVEV